MEQLLVVKMINPGFYEIVVSREKGGRKLVRQVLSENVIDELMDHIDGLPTLGRDITRLEAMEQFKILRKGQ